MVLSEEIPSSLPREKFEEKNRAETLGALSPELPGPNLPGAGLEPATTRLHAKELHPHCLKRNFAEKVDQRSESHGLLRLIRRGSNPQPVDDSTALPLSYEGTPISLPQIGKMFSGEFRPGLTWLIAEPWQELNLRIPKYPRSHCRKNGGLVGTCTLLSRLKDGCFALKASNPEMVVTVGFEPALAALSTPCLFQLGYVTV